jgi:hypothetical protein
MDIDFGDADAGVGIAISVLSDYLAELQRIGQLPQQVTFQRVFNGQDVDVLVLIDPPVFELIQVPNAEPYTRVHLTGSIEVRPAGQPDASPIVLGLNAAALLSLVLVGQRAVGLQYDGVDGQPLAPVTEADIDNLFTSPEVAAALEKTIDLATPLIAGLNQSRFPDARSRPDDSAWAVELTLMPGGEDSVDGFAVTAGPPGTTARPSSTESFVAPNTGLAVAYNRAFLDLLLSRGAAAEIGQTVSGANVVSLTLQMSDTAIMIQQGHVVRPIDTPLIDVIPDVDIRFEGPMVPSLVRGTTGMAFDTSGVAVRVDESDKIFQAVLRWFFTLGAAALLFTGWASLTALGILLWISAVQPIWNADAQLDNAPNLIRDSLATILGAHLSALADSLDDDTAVPPLRIDATPDSLVVVHGGIVLFAQILVVPIEAMMRTAEYSRRLRRFAIFELSDGRRFRAQELARLMKAGKVTVPGFHQVDGNYLRADPDNVEANNLLQSFKQNETTEVVVRSRRS